MKNFKVLILFVWILLTVGCSSTKRKSPFAPKEYIDVKFLDDEFFEYYHYKFNDFDDFSYAYCEGKFSTLKGNVKVLTPSFFDKENLDISLEEETIKDQKLRIQIETKNKCNSDIFNTLLHLDSTTIFLKGTEIDTLIEYSNFESVKVEILLLEEKFKRFPAFSFQSISTKKVFLKEKNSNSLKIKVPVIMSMFYYKDIGETKVKELANYYLLVESGEKFKKERAKINCTPSLSVE